MNERPDWDFFIRAMEATDRLYGGSGETNWDRFSDAELYEVAPHTFIGFHRGYFAILVPKDGRPFSRRILVKLAEKLEKTHELRSIVHHKNVDSIIGTRRLGATLEGVDDNGYFHYLLTRESYKYGKVLRPPAAEPAAD